MFVHGEWMCAVDGSVPRFLRVGRGTALFISGWLFHRRSPLRSLTLRVGDAEHRVGIHSMPRLDVYRAHGREDDDPPTAAYQSGFWTVLPVPGTAEPRETELALQATNAAGEKWEQTITSIGCTAGVVAPPGPPSEPGLIAICMATHNPEIELFRRQVESIRAQTHERWRCIISDDLSRPDAFAAIARELEGDARFELHRNTQRLQFYFNFERALQHVPGEAEAVALADQDDEWYPDKLATLLSALHEGATLAYSDQRIVRADGDVVAPSYWMERRNQWTDLRTLVLANTVTGAASLFRREVLDLALPFPPRLAAAFHDHWLAAVALACGRIAYVDRPLYDYVQHGENVIGHAGAHGGAGDRRPPPDRGPRERELLLSWQADYFRNVVPQQLVATVLLERLGDRARAGDRAMLRRLAAGDATPTGVFEHLRILPRSRRAITDNHDREAVAGLAWRRWSRLRARRSRRPYADERHTVHPRPGYVDYGPDNYPHMPHRPLEALVGPPRLLVDAAAPARVNILVTAEAAAADPGLATALVGGLARAGLAARIITRGGPLVPGLQAPAIEVVEDGGQELVVSPDDRWIATDWTAAHAAAAAAAQSGRRTFVYAIGPSPRPGRASAALVEASYRLPHRALFAGELVRRFFEARRIGVYALEPAGGDPATVVLEPPVGGAVATAQALAARRPRALVVAAPDREAAEAALPALDATVVEGHLEDGAWELWAGPWAGGARVPLARGRFLEPLPEHDDAAWQAACARADVGLALGLVPEPGASASRLAAAGATVVVPLAAGITDEALRTRSSNFLPAEATPGALAAALTAAIRRADDVPARLAGAAIDAPRSWDEALADGVLERIVALLDDNA